MNLFEVSFVRASVSWIGSPPEKFNTNRSERTNGIIQDYITRECGVGAVNEYVFTLFRDGFLSISQSQHHGWSSMTKKQKDTALKKVHTSKLEDVTPDSATAVSRAIGKENNQLMTTFLSMIVEWIRMMC